MGVRLLVLAVLAVALMVVDARFDLLKPARKQASLVLMDAYWITDLPGRLWEGVASQFGSRTELYVPKWLEPQVKVEIGQAVRGGADILVVLGKPIHTMQPAKSVGEEYEPLLGRETPA